MFFFGGLGGSRLQSPFSEESEALRCDGMSGVRGFGVGALGVGVFGVGVLGVGVFGVGVFGLLPPKP